MRYLNALMKLKFVQYQPQKWLNTFLWYCKWLNYNFGSMNGFKLSRVSVTVISSYTLCWLPYKISSLIQIFLISWFFFFKHLFCISFMSIHFKIGRTYLHDECDLFNKCQFIRTSLLMKFSRHLHFLWSYKHTLLKCEMSDISNFGLYIYHV